MINFNSQEFDTRAQFGTYLQRAVHTLPMRSDLRGADHELVLAILHLRRGCDEKIGAGIATFSVHPTGNNGREIRFRRVDGSTDNFSWRRVLTGEFSRSTYVNAALRYAIWPQIVTFKEAAFSGRALVPSALSGVMLSEAEAEVDHVGTPYMALRDRWVASIGGSELAEFTRSTGAVKSAAVLSNVEQSASWSGFHREHARLRIISARENRELGAELCRPLGRAA